MAHDNLIPTPEDRPSPGRQPDRQEQSPTKQPERARKGRSSGDTDYQPQAGLPWHYLFWFFVLAVAMQSLLMFASGQASLHTIAYSDFKQMLMEHRVIHATVQEALITGEAKGPAPENAPAPAANQQAPSAGATPPSENDGAGKNETPTNSGKKSVSTDEKGATAKKPDTFAFRTVRVDDPDLVRQMEQAGVKFVGDRPGVWSQFMWTWLLPIGFMILLWRLLTRRLSGIGQGVMGFGASKAKLVADKNTGVNFADVAGCEEAKFELQEVVNFLKTPGRYEALGAKIPKGVLLVGPPGTGKTLLARAVAGEAGVAFFSISGSEFIEMFVGVGAARVRDLFEKAKSQAPSIIFIDELDSIGRQRSVHMGVVSDEREQTLNQLLAGMDGFEANVGVVVLAATNRPEILDHALLRPGRFDRQIVVDAPDLDGRLAILKLHQRGKPLAADADLRRIAQETPGFSGADLANLMNEAALLAARHRAEVISQSDLQEAVVKVVAGPERRSRRLNAKDKHLVAVHEAGHALVAAYTGHADTVHKISIVPRGHAALGYTMQLPADDQYLSTRGELLDKIKGLLGGRAAEEVIFNDFTTGAENDLEHATALARQMICVFGMGQSAGLVHCAARHPQFLPLPAAENTWQRDCSEETAREIDQEVKGLLEESYVAAKRILQEHENLLGKVANELLEKETLDARAFKQLLENR